MKIILAIILIIVCILIEYNKIEYFVPNKNYIYKQSTIPKNTNQDRQKLQAYGEIFTDKSRTQTDRRIHHSRNPWAARDHGHGFQEQQIQILKSNSLI